MKQIKWDTIELTAREGHQVHQISIGKRLMYIWWYTLDLW